MKSNCWKYKSTERKLIEIDVAQSWLSVIRVLVQLQVLDEHILLVADDGGGRVLRPGLLVVESVVEGDGVAVVVIIVLSRCCVTIIVAIAQYETSINLQKQIIRSAD